MGRWCVEGRQGEGGREEGTRGGQGRHHIFPQVSVSGGQRDRQSVLPGPVLPNPPSTPGPLHPQASPMPPSAVLPSPNLSQRPSAASGLHSPLNILSGGGLRCHPCSTAFILDLGPGRNRAFQGHVC